MEFDAIRPGALYNYNMLACLDRDLLMNVSRFIREGGKPADLPKQGFDLETDPDEMKNLAADRPRHGDLLVAMNGKLNKLVETEVGEDIGQMMPKGKDANW